MIPRYSISEMAEIWTDEAMYRRWFKLETRVLLEQIAQRVIDPVDLIEPQTTSDRWTEEVEKAEEVTKHDFTAFLKVMGQRFSEKHRQFLHLGLTSSDIKDTATMMALRDATKMILAKVSEIVRLLEAQSKTFKSVPFLGRTHGQTAEMLSLGHKFEVWALDIYRAEKRLQLAQETCNVGKLSGPVGTYNQYITPAIERAVLDTESLKGMHGCTQVIPRDIIADLIFAMAQLATAIGHICTNIRLHCIEDVGEFKEGFSTGQTGSSAMPHKRNPIGFEQMTGMARQARSYVQPAMENIDLWHERDMSHSSVERSLLPDATGTVYYMLVRFQKLLQNMYINESMIERNIQQAGIKWATARLLSALVVAGANRNDVYEFLQREEFLSPALVHQQFRQYLSLKEVLQILSSSYYLQPS